jgi:hypothetical protein
MLLPDPIDQLQEVVGRLLAKLRKWSPVGLRVALKINEGPHFGAILKGTIIDLCEKHDSGAVIKLDNPWNVGNRLARWILATQHFHGHGVYRLLVTSCDVNLMVLDSAQAPTDLSREQFVAIADMRLE